MIRSFSSFSSIHHKAGLCLATVMVLLPLLGISTAHAQDDTDEVVIFVLDLSGSMNEPFDSSQTKLDVAKEAFVEAFANVNPNALVGLRTYGDQIAPTAPADREASCTTDTRLLSPVAPLQREELIGQVQGFSALGDTPMGLALREASTDIPFGSTGTIVLFSDGRDECFDADLDGDPAVGPSFGEDPCEIAKAITAGDSAVDRVVTVGFRADSAAATELRCIAEATGGTYTSIESPEDAQDALPELLVQLSAPREAQRLLGQEIQGNAGADANTPSLLRLDEAGVDQVLYTDSIDMNSQRVYRFDGYGPEGGTVTATVFGLPAEADITFDVRVWVPALNREFFIGENADTNAGLPARQTASIRCTECTISGGPHDVFWVLSLVSPTAGPGNYEIEMLTEGPGFGGGATSCTAPQACFYPQEIADKTAQLEEIRGQLDGDVEGLAPRELVDERDSLREQTAIDQEAISTADKRSAEIEALIPLAPSKSNSFAIPLLMILGAALLAFAPVHKLKRDGEGDEDLDPAPVDHPQAEPLSGHPPDLPPERSGPSLDVGPPPAVSPNRKGDGNSWDAELEAAKEALAQQRPERPRPPVDGTTPAPPPRPAPETPAPETAAPPAPRVDEAGEGAGLFTAEQHAAAKAAAQKIAAQQAEAAGPALPGPPAMPAAPMSKPSPDTPPEPATASVAEQPAAQQAEADQAAIEAAQQAAADAAEQAAAEQAALEAAEQAAADQAAIEAAQQAAAEKAAADQAAIEAAQQAAADAAEQAAREAAALEAAEKAAAEQAAREAAERAAAEQAAADQAAIEAAQQAAAEKAAADQAAIEAAQQAAAEKAAADQAAIEAAQQAAADAAEQAAREAAALEAAEKAAREAAEKAAAEQAAREAAERAAQQGAEQAAAQAEAQAAQQAAEQAVEASPRPAADLSAMTEEERRQEARRRMLAKQNIVASSSGSGQPGAGSNATTGSAGPMTVPPATDPAAPARPAAQPAPMAPGWYEDPAIMDQFRWWDGQNWTAHTSKPEDQGKGPA